MGWAGQSGDGAAASALQEAVEHHRQQLERLAMTVARIERIDREVAEMNAERAAAVQEYEKIYADLTSGRAAGDAIAALGLTVVSKASGRAKKSGRSPRRAAAKRGRAQRGAGAGQAAPAPGASAAGNERVGDVPAAAGAAVGA
ncbi:hypothetical protein BN1232_06126 [Mycobacterium lentiflavum]|uniref:Uncharacterized protein n=2 Tax=Mycobacterium lentiflavum TaxID=141349 RepID=A0A0E4H363_MYCLN|nr:hypothetical protein BN1232_06126 [Mycobacterium lentiflavum]